MVLNSESAELQQFIVAVQQLEQAVERLHADVERLCTGKPLEGFPHETRQEAN